MVLSVLLAAILDFLRDSWPGLRTWNSSNKNVILNSKVKFVCPMCTKTWCIIMIIETLSAILAAILFLQFWKGKTKNRAWHGADLESAYPNCVKTTTWQILLRNALQTLRMPLFEKWALSNTSYIHVVDIECEYVSLLNHTYFQEYYFQEHNNETKFFRYKWWCNCVKF